MARTYFLALVQVNPPSPTHCEATAERCRFAPREGAECGAFLFDLERDSDGLLRCDRCLESEAADRAPIRGVA